MGTFKRRRRRGKLCQAVCLFALLFEVQSQESKRASPSSSSNEISASTSFAASATSTAVTLTESVPVLASLDVNSASPARFFLSAPFKNASNPLYVSASLCSGPAIPAYNFTDPEILTALSLDSYDATLITLPRMYVSTDTANQVPGPNNLAGDPDVQYLLGGYVQDENTDKDVDGAWITIWPPLQTRNVTGTWTMTVTASTEGPPMSLISDAGLTFADSDRNTALLTSSNYSMGTSPNLTLYVLPTSGPGALDNADYFNSSLCAISSAYAAFNVSENQDRLEVNSSETQRGLLGSQKTDQTRLQFQVANLDSSTNYTAWLVEYGQMGDTAIQNASIWPAVKFVTKKSRNCRLVYDVDFCPQVAYSIPVSPDVPTQQALEIINNTVTPNYDNFTATLGTFPCESDQFGLYSPVQTCADCTQQYQDWLCAVTMPRCVDPLVQVNDNTSAATTDPLSLNGDETETNPSLLPYIINRSNNSRQSYIDASDGLDAGTYGELLPCIFTCYFVSRTCPAPLIQWTCPIWDISAQADYGTFADVGINSGSGDNGQKWGGPSRYIAQDAFGNLYCNSMGTETLLRQINAATGIAPSSILLLTTSLTTIVFVWTAFF